MGPSAGESTEMQMGKDWLAWTVEMGLVLNCRLYPQCVPQNKSPYLRPLYFLLRSLLRGLSSRFQCPGFTIIISLEIFFTSKSVDCSWGSTPLATGLRHQHALCQTQIDATAADVLLRELCQSYAHVGVVVRSAGCFCAVSLCCFYIRVDHLS